MTQYKNIEKVETLDDGTLNVFLKNGKAAIVEILRLNEKFQAAIYHMLLPSPTAMHEPKKKNLLIELEKHEGYKACAKDALGWIDNNTDNLFIEEEKRIF